MSFTKLSPVLTTLKKRIKSALKHSCSEAFPLWAHCTVSCRGQTGPVVYQAVLYLSPQEGSRPFISSRLGCFQSRLKPQHLFPPLSPTLKPPVSPIKLSTACSSPLCSIHRVGKSPTTDPPSDPSHCLFTAVTKGGN